MTAPSPFHSNLMSLFGSIDRPIVSPFCDGESRLFHNISAAPQDAVLFVDLPRPDYSVEVAHAAAASSGRAFVIGNETNSFDLRKSMRGLGLNLFQVSGSEGDSGHIFGTPQNLGSHPAVIPYVESPATDTPKRVLKAPDSLIKLRKSDLFIFDDSTDVVEDKRIVTGVAMSANERDSDEQFFDTETVFEAMIGFMLWYRNIGLEHIVDINEEVDIVESWQLREDMIVDGKTANTGSWMMSLKIWSPRIWEALRNGSLAGFSIGGDAFEISAELEEIPTS